MSADFVAQPYLSWGRVERKTRLVAHPAFTGAAPRLIAQAPPGGVLGVGLGRSYGDSGLDADGALICCRGLDRFIAFDRQSGVLTAEAGVSLDEVLRLIVPHGWFLPTTPGTRFVTLGGAVANDVHGKNHHVAGSFGCGVLSLVLVRSDLGRMTLSRTQSPELFFATLGGLGLTGLIEQVELQLVRIASSDLDQETVPFAGLDGYFDLDADSQARFEHVSAWIDCAAGGSRLGRGVLFRANWAPNGALTPHDAKARAMPIEAPAFTLNRFSIAAFNALYYGMHSSKRGFARVPYAAGFYPLDGVRQWNLMYGKPGFFQHQSVIPPAAAREGVRAMLTLISASGQGSFLAVLKSMGDKDFGGLTSFPQPGVSLALDFPNRGPETLALLDRLDAIVVEAGGRIYPAKDDRMAAATFQAGYPRWRELEARRDPAFQSSFWRRVTQ